MGAVRRARTRAGRGHRHERVVRREVRGLVGRCRRSDREADAPAAAPGRSSDVGRRVVHRVAGVVTRVAGRRDDERALRGRVVDRPVERRVVARASEAQVDHARPVVGRPRDALDRRVVGERPVHARAHRKHPRRTGDALRPDAVAVDHRDQPRDERAVPHGIEHGAVAARRVVAGKQTPGQVGLRDVDTAVDDGDDRRRAASDGCDRGSRLDGVVLPVEGQTGDRIGRVERVGQSRERAVRLGELDARIMGGEIGDRRGVRCDERHLADRPEDLQRARRTVAARLRRRRGRRPARRRR